MQPLVLAPYKDAERARRTRDEIVARLGDDFEEASRLLGFTVQSKQDVFDAVTALLEREMTLPTYRNDAYQVVVEEVKVMSFTWPDETMICLSIRRLDREPIRDWRDLQEIKNQLVGPENEAVELFPAESRLVDSANQFYLWVFKNPAVRVPFGFRTRYVVDDALSTTKQRKRT